MDMLRSLILCVICLLAAACRQQSSPAYLVRTAPPKAVPQQAPADHSAEKEATQQKIRAVAASAHPVKLYHHSYEGSDDGSFGWVLGAYNGPKHYIGSLAPADFAELLSCAEAPDAPYNDAFVHVDAITEEGDELSLSLYYDQRDPEPILSLPYLNLVSRTFWKKVDLLLNRKYDLPARVRRSGLEQ